MFNNVYQMVDVVFVGFGFVYVLKDLVVYYVEVGWFGWVLEDWFLMFVGYYVYYLSWCKLLWVVEFVVDVFRVGY